MQQTTKMYKQDFGGIRDQLYMDASEVQTLLSLYVMEEIKGFTMSEGNIKLSASKLQPAPHHPPHSKESEEAAMGLQKLALHHFRAAVRGASVNRKLPAGAPRLVSICRQSSELFDVKAGGIKTAELGSSYCGLMPFLLGIKYFCN